MRYLFLLIALWWCLLLPAPSWALTVEDVPLLSELEAEKGKLWVLDDANTISSSTESEVSRELAALAQAKDIQIRFVTVKRIDFGQPVQEFTEALFTKWFPEPVQQANQGLIVVAVEDHRTGIAYGEKVKAVIPESVLQSTVSKNILFPVQKANYNQALIEGTNRLVAVAEGKPDPGEPVVVQESAETRNYATAEETDDNTSTIVVVVLLVLATVIPMATYYWLQNQS